MILTFTVPGPAVGKERARVVRRGGRTWAFTPKRTREWERRVWLHAIAARDACGVWPCWGTTYPTGGWLCCRVDVVFVGTRADVDNASKSLLDGMRGAVYGDDRQVVQLHAEKRTLREAGGLPRTEVTVEVLS